MQMHGNGLGRVQPGTAEISIGRRYMMLSLVHTHKCRCICPKVEEELHECKAYNERRRGERVELSSQNGDYMRSVPVSSVI